MPDHLADPWWRETIVAAQRRAAVHYEMADLYRDGRGGWWFAMHEQREGAFWSGLAREWAQIEVPQ